jgi:hypothetical protein
MKKINFFLLSASLLFISAAQAQTVDDIVNKHTDAIGGKDKIGQVKTVYIENSVEAMGNTSASVEYLVQGKGYKSESDFNGMKLISCLTDKGGWMINPFAGGTDAQAMPDEAYKASKDQIYFGGSLVDYGSKGNKVELAGEEGNNIKLKVAKDGAETTYFIDKTTYYITKVVTKAEMMGQSVEIETNLSDYKKTDFGIVVPYTRKVNYGGFEVTSKVSKIEVNKEIDPKIFEMPK